MIEPSINLVPHEICIVRMTCLFGIAFRLANLIWFIWLGTKFLRTYSFLGKIIFVLSLFIKTKQAKVEFGNLDLDFKLIDLKCLDSKSIEFRSYFKSKHFKGLKFFVDLSNSNP